MEDVRRSLTILGENDERVQKCRAIFLGGGTGNEPADVDYTVMVNMLIEIGTGTLNELVEKMKTDSVMPDIIKKYLPKE
jgi:hypothetical protein